MIRHRKCCAGTGGAEQSTNMDNTKTNAADTTPETINSGPLTDTGLKAGLVVELNGAPKDAPLDITTESNTKM